jgi:hypothetical protein
VLEFRSSIVIGSGSLSFELVRALVERLPVMITPCWVLVGWDHGADVATRNGYTPARQSISGASRLSSRIGGCASPTILLQNQRQEFTTGGLVGFEHTAHGRGHHDSPWFLHATHGHTGVRRFHHDERHLEPIA